MKISEGKWEVAKGGRSVNAGRHGKIRQEGPEHVQGNMLLVSKAPLMLKALRKVSEYEATKEEMGLHDLIEDVLIELNEIELPEAL